MEEPSVAKRMPIVANALTNANMPMNLYIQMRTLFPSRALLRRRVMYHILLFQPPNVKGNTTILHGIMVIQMETYGVDGALRLV
jgi:hypothetical protein